MSREFNCSLREELLKQLQAISYLGSANLSLLKNIDGQVMDTVIHKERSSAKKRQRIWSTAGHSENLTGSASALNAENYEMTKSFQPSENSCLSASAEITMDFSMERILRADLEGVVLPKIQNQLATFKADTEAKLIAVRQTTDDMAQKLESCMRKFDQDRSFRSGNSSTGHFTRVGFRENAGTGAPNPLMLTPDSNDILPASHAVQQWKKSWVFRWRIGTLWVTLVSRTEHSATPTSGMQQIRQSRSSRTTYAVFIEFLPVQFLIKIRGVSIAYTSEAFNRRYSVLWPNLTTFAVIPDDSLVMKYAEENDVEGLRQVLIERRAAPSDRNLKGETPLHVGCLYQTLICYD